MKKILFMSLVLWLSAGHAQYFTTVYGDPVFAPPQMDGFNSVLNPGLIISSPTTGPTGLVEPQFVKTNNVGTTQFSKHYAITVGGVAINAGFTPKVFELPDLTGYGVVATGQVTVGGALVNRPFYYQVDLNGIPKGGGFGSYYNNLGTTNADIGGGSNLCIRVISASEFLLACGNNVPAGTFTVLKINIGSRGVVASAMLTVSGATNVTTESIMVNPYNTSEIVIAGNMTTSAGINPDAYVTKLDLATFAPTSPLTYYVAGGSTDLNKVYSMRVMTNTGIAPPTVSSGFILGGTYLGAGSTNDMWALAIDPSLNVLKSVKLDNTAPVDNSGYDIIERFNTLNNYEYYLAGSEFVAGVNNNEIMKLDNTLSAGTYYESSSNAELGFKIDQLNNMATGGLSLFGIRGVNQLSINKLYFNGVTPCTYGTFTPVISSLTCKVKTTSISKSDNLVDATLVAAASNTAPMGTICSAVSMSPPGSNVKVLKNNGNTVMAPNPANLNDLLTIDLSEENSSIGQHVNVSIFDITGRSFYEGNVILNADHKIRLNLAGMDLKEGVYMVKLSGEGLDEHKVLRITN